jgi:hypothetical protein
LQDIWRRQPDRSSLGHFVLFNYGGLPEVDSDDRVTTYQPCAAAAIALAHKNVGYEDAGRNQVR